MLVLTRRENEAVVNGKQEGVHTMNTSPFPPGESYHRIVIETFDDDLTRFERAYAIGDGENRIAFFAIDLHSALDATGFWTIDLVLSLCEAWFEEHGSDDEDEPCKAEADAMIAAVYAYTTALDAWRKACGGQRI